MPQQVTKQPWAEMQSNKDLLQAINSLYKSVKHSAKDGSLDNWVGEKLTGFTGNFPFISDWLSPKLANDAWARVEKSGKNVPANRTMLMTGMKDLANKKVYDLARSTFTEEVFKRIENLSAKASDSPDMVISKALLGKGSAFAEDILRRKYEDALSPKDLEDLITSTVTSKAFMDHLDFLGKYKLRGKRDLQDIDLNPHMYNYDGIKNFVSSRINMPFDPADYADEVDFGEEAPAPGLDRKAALKTAYEARRKQLADDKLVYDQLRKRK